MIPEKLTHDGRGFRNNWLVMEEFPEKGSRRQRFPKNVLVTVELSGKTGSLRQFPEKRLMTTEVSEKVAHDGRGFRINWIMTAV
jgi:hypothetical protein